MPAGIQCFDETGKLIVDLSDRQLTLVGDTTISSMSGNGNTLEQTYVGIHPSNTVGYIINSQLATESNALARRVGVAIAVIAQDTYRVVSIDGLSPSLPLHIRFYKFK